MKATLKQIRDSAASVQLLLNGKRMPPQASYAVSKLASAVSNELNHFNTQRRKIFLEAGCTIDEKNGVFIHLEGQKKIDEISKQVEEMCAVEVELNALPLDLNQFGNAELDGAAFFGLEWAMKQQG